MQVATATEPALKQKYRWFVAGDFNGFFGLIFDNLTVLSYLSLFLIGFGFPADVIYTRMFPGTAIGVLFGDLVYTWMAFRLARKTGRSDVTAMPLGLDTPSTIGLALIVLGPAFVAFKKQGLSEHDAAMMTWYMGMATMIFMGAIKLVFSFLGTYVQRAVPQAGLLGSLAGIGIGLIGIAPLLDIFGLPIVGLLALGIVFYCLVARIRLPWGVPGVLASVLVGTAIYYLLAGAGLTPGVHLPSLQGRIAFPTPTLGFMHGVKAAIAYLPLSIPFALLTVVGGVNVTESARVAGDDYNSRDILLTEAIATLLAGVCGGVAQTTPYIGHPAYKNMGSRAGYTLLTGIVVGLGGVLGYISFVVELIPRAVLAPILVFVALDITMQAFQAVPKAHGAAVALSFFPTLARLLAIKMGISQEELDKAMGSSAGALPEKQVIVALGNGFILTAMLWGAFLAKLIDRRLRAAAGYLAVLALFSFFGIVHSAMADGQMYLPWNLEWAKQVPYQFTMAYLALAALLVVLSSTKEAKEMPLESHD